MCVRVHARLQQINLQNVIIPLTGPPDTPGDSIAVNNFSHEAVVSTLNHSENILLQHRLTLCGLSSLISLSLASVRPSSTPISLQSAAYCGVTCPWSSRSVGVVNTIDKNKLGS